MDHQPLFIYLFLLLSVTISAAGAYVDPDRSIKLFVFGGSYVDTGNRDSTARSWKEPYGITDPGRPAGHFSDGQVFTEYIGVFDTWVAAPNMTEQIYLFEQLLQEKIYTRYDLKFSTALVSASGMDYRIYLARRGSLRGFPAFIISVVNQLGLDLQRIHDLGVPQVAVMGMQPLGCLPEFTRGYSYEKCNSTGNFAALYHNLLLVKKLKPESKFVVLDMYNAFMSAMKKFENKTETSELKNPLRPCCTGITSEYRCGDVENKEKKYNVCRVPKLAFFWDSFHPTQAGWDAIVSELGSSIISLF
ncbi:GDSL esterase/lipase At5g03610 [Vitis vinifera]|uniref:GDSL esterase/lipase At5g03610 n=1 Tax=Vitis vinifera TaxID=29760 RepID=UPI0028832AC9|nr:GDSL esterase/lipase At5g03610 [Vitis vinifera]